VRTVQSGLAWLAGTSLIASVPRGDTLIRVHFGWGFYGDVAATSNLLVVAQNLQVMGIVSTVGDGTETAPNARTASANQAPPTQRWIFWEARAPRLAALDMTSGGLAIWQDSGSQEPVQTKGMISAKSIPVGDTLNIWASWAGAYAWDPTGVVNLWYYASLAYQPST